jgi:hypothetical protein
MRTLVVHFTVVPVAMVIAIVAGMMIHDLAIGVIIGIVSSLVILAVIDRVWRPHA